VRRWDAGEMDATFAALRAPVLAIQSTTRNAWLQRPPALTRTHRALLDGGPAQPATSLL
jgi:hypothetical protein